MANNRWLESGSASFGNNNYAYGDDIILSDGSFYSVNNNGTPVQLASQSDLEATESMFGGMKIIRGGNAVLAYVNSSTLRYSTTISNLSGSWFVVIGLLGQSGTPFTSKNLENIYYQISGTTFSITAEGTFVQGHQLVVSYLMIGPTV